MPIKFSRRWAEVLFFVVAAIAMAVVDDLASTLSFLTSTRGAAATTAFVVLYAALLLGVFALWSSRGFVRHVAFHLSIASIAVTTATRALNRAGFGIEEARIFLFEHGFAREALISFPFVYAAGALAGVVVGAALYRAGDRLLPRATTLPRAAMIVAAITATAALPSFVSFVPAPVRVPVSLLSAATHRAPDHTDAIRPPQQAARARHIVIVVDESVRADAFVPPDTDGVIDFGASLAATNCSAPANYILRTGVTSLPVSAAPRPTLFDYARRAGLRTILIDGQSRSHAPRNLMSRAEIERLDQHVVVRARGDLAPEEIDTAIAREVARRVRDPRPSLIWVNKYGAHFHYETSYPDHAAVHHPHLGDREPLRNELRTINSYRNAVQWSVRGFFSPLGDLPADSVLIYTSDHGQSLPGEGSRYPHCVADGAPPSQLLVPLIVIGDLPELRSASLSARHRTSHHQIFPTVLWLLGFDAERGLRNSHPQRPPALIGDIFGRGTYELVSVDSALREVRCGSCLPHREVVLRTSSSRPSSHR